MSKTRFTLRLNEEEYHELTNIKTLAGLSTNTMAIRYLIKNYIELNNRYLDAISKNTELKTRYREQDQNVEALLIALEKLSLLKGIKNVVPGNKKK